MAPQAIIRSQPADALPSLKSLGTRLTYTMQVDQHIYSTTRKPQREIRKHKAQLQRINQYHWHDSVSGAELQLKCLSQDLTVEMENYSRHDGLEPEGDSLAVVTSLTGTIHDSPTVLKAYIVYEQGENM